MINSLNDLKYIHFVGVGGVSMSKLCSYCLSKGIKCSGSDISKSKIIDELRAKGALICLCDGSNMAKSADLVVYSSAIPLDHPDIIAAKTVMERKEFLRIFARNFGKVVAISGSHGKTTTASIISWILRYANFNFTAHIGGEIIGINPLEMNYGDNILVIEACEYRKSFLHLNPDISIILNIDYDHPDCYQSIDEVYNAFGQFALQSKCVISNGDYDIKKVARNINREKSVKIDFVNYSYNDDDYLIQKIKIKDGLLSMRILKNYLDDVAVLGDFTMPSYNAVVAECATSAIIACIKLGIDISVINKAMTVFPGVKHRFQCLGKKSCGTRVIADYSHHPREIKKVIEASKGLNSNKVIAVFQPHTYSRTKALLNEFVEALSDADVVIVMATYSARETENDGVNSITLYQNLCGANINAIYCEDYVDVDNWIKKNTVYGDLVLVLGAGIDLDKINMD